MRQTTLRLGPARSMARRFITGETLDEAIAAVRALSGQGLLATLDHLGENVTSDIEARDATTDILDLLEAIEASGVQSGVSVKRTQLGREIDTDVRRDRNQRAAKGRRPEPGH